MKANRVLMMSLMSLATSVTAAFAAEAPPAFDATYSVADNHGNNAQLHKLSDGAGHTRTEMDIATGKNISIVDYNTMTIYNILESQKIITRGHYKGDAEAEGAALLQDLGTKTVNGRTCTGKIETVKGGIKETWTDKNIKIMVSTTFNGGGLKRSTNLTALSTAVPGPENFTIPSGYTMMTK